MRTTKKASFAPAPPWPEAIENFVVNADATLMRRRPNISQEEEGYERSETQMARSQVLQQSLADAPDDYEYYYKTEATPLPTPASYAWEDLEGEACGDLSLTERYQSAGDLVGSLEACQELCVNLFNDQTPNKTCAGTAYNSDEEICLLWLVPITNREPSPGWTCSILSTIQTSTAAAALKKAAEAGTVLVIIGIFVICCIIGVLLSITAFLYFDQQKFFEWVYLDVLRGDNDDARKEAVARIAREGVI
jgi:hypothetical protein